MHGKNSFDDERMEGSLTEILHVSDMNWYIHSLKTWYFDKRNITVEDKVLIQV